jgi:fructosamine-3-kinase
LSGGDVAHSYAVDLVDGGRVFAKTHAAPPADFFTTEAAGLSWLREPGVVNVPEVLAVADDPPVLVLEWIPLGGGARRTQEGEADFGRSLARLHRTGAPTFGRQDGRTTGSRGLPNDQRSTWAEFYASQRLLPLARLATDAYALPSDTVAGLERIAGRLADLVGPPERPARLHGDLWAGNRVIDDTGRSWLIDPACFGGHREFDLAMMRLFGGFDDAVFLAYHEEWPLADGHEERVLLMQLAPLTVHAIKFGGPYVSATADAVDRYQ